MGRPSRSPSQRGISSVNRYPAPVRIVEVSAASHSGRILNRFSVLSSIGREAPTLGWARQSRADLARDFWAPILGRDGPDLVGVGQDMLASTAKPSPDSWAAFRQRSTVVSNLTQRVAFAELATAIPRDRRLIRDLSVQPKPTDPPIGRVQVDLVTQTTFGPDAHDVADHQHSDSEFGLYEGRPTWLQKGRGASRRLSPSRTRSISGSR